MSTHNICFYGELTKIILQLSSNIHLICCTESAAQAESSVHTKQLVARIFVAATNLSVCTGLQHVSRWVYTIKVNLVKAGQT